MKYKSAQQGKDPTHLHPASLGTHRYCIAVQSISSLHPDPSHSLILFLSKNVFCGHQKLHYLEMFTLFIILLSRFVSALIASIKTALRKKQQLGISTLDDLGPSVPSHTM